MIDSLASPVEIVTAPTEEPLTLAEVKEHLRVDIDTEDAYLTALITAARRSIEHDTGRAIITQTLRLHMDHVPCGAASIWLPRAPLQSVESITYIDADGDTQTFAAANYHVDTHATPGRVYLAENASWPTDIPGARRPDAFLVKYTAGYGPAAAVPEDLKHAIRFLIAHWFANREPVNIGNIVNPLPRAVDALVWQYKVF